MRTERFELAEATPLYKKALEIMKLVDHILAAAPEAKEEDDPLQFQIRDMHANSMLIPAKISGAEGGDIYDLRMENAALIRKAARELVVGLRGLEMFGFNEPRYFNLLRDEMEEFRKLFIAWVAAFDKSNYIPDSWGLFNPPGVGPDDEMEGWGGDDDDDDFDDDGPKGGGHNDPF